MKGITFNVLKIMQDLINQLKTGMKQSGYQHNVVYSMAGYYTVPLRAFRGEPLSGIQTFHSVIPTSRSFKEGSSAEPGILVRKISGVGKGTFIPNSALMSLLPLESSFVEGFFKANGAVGYCSTTGYEGQG